MTRGILVIDELPERCEDCKFNVHYDYVDRKKSTDDRCVISTFHKCILTNTDGDVLEWSEYCDEDGIWDVHPTYDRPDFCPLKEAPTKINDFKFDDFENG